MSHTLLLVANPTTVSPGKDIAILFTFLKTLQSFSSFFSFFAGWES
jgi:hypothetical protein